MRLAFVVAALVFVIDQATKWLVVHHLDLINRLTIDVWPPFLTFRMGWNRGVNFGLLSGADMRWVLIGLAVLICAAVLWWVRREKAPPRVMAAAGLLVGGAAGNVVDRVVYGAVADFLNMSCCGIENPYAFNVADIAVFLGAIGLILFSPTKPAETRQGP
jgi:signal peptidase II